MQQEVWQEGAIALHDVAIKDTCKRQHVEIGVLMKQCRGKTLHEGADDASAHS